MTYEEIFRKAQQVIGAENISDYRPAVLSGKEGTMCNFSVCVPNTVMIWLKNHDCLWYREVAHEGKKTETELTDVDLAFGIIEDVLDTLIEVGNGVTDEMLHAEADKLFGLRYFLTSLFRPQYLEFGEHQEDRKCWEEVKRNA